MYKLLFFFLLIPVSFLSCASPMRNSDLIYQESTIGKLDDGEFEGMISMGELKHHGDFGIGTFDGLDGEMVGVDGEFFQVDYKGAAQVADDKITTPFAMVTFFESDKTVNLTGEFNYGKLITTLDEYLPSKDIIYAIKITGKFDYLKTRSVPKQIKPYPPLKEVVKEQSIFEYRDTKGTAVGFWVPSYMKDINVQGYHLHFISEDKKSGGHLLELKIANPTIFIDFNSRLRLSEIDD